VLSSVLHGAACLQNLHSAGENGSSLEFRLDQLKRLGEFLDVSGEALSPVLEAIE